MKKNEFETIKKPEWLTRDQASEYLCQPKSWLENDAVHRSRRVPYHKIGKRALYLKKDLDEFIASTRREKNK